MIPARREDRIIGQGVHGVGEDGLYAVLSRILLPAAMMDGLEVGPNSLSAQYMVFMRNEYGTNVWGLYSTGFRTAVWSTINHATAFPASCNNGTIGLA